jgi:uncharacterized phiE125 gp8 family phage protein
MGLLLLEAPTEPVVTAAEAQAQVRSEDPAEVPLLESLIAAATEQAEGFCRRRFVTQRWRLSLDAFPAVCMSRPTRRRTAIVVPYPPLASVQSVKYLDGDGVLQTVDPADYSVRTMETPGEIVPAYGTTWPTARDVEDAVRVEFTCGYGGAATVPEGVKRAILLLVGTLYANRESVAPVQMAELPHSVEWLLGRHAVRRFAE